MKGPTKEEWDASELAVCEESWRGGHLVALNDAVEFCHFSQIPLPEWAALAIINLVREKYFAPGSGDRSCNPKWRYEQDFIHYVRWNRMKAYFNSEAVNDAQVAVMFAPADRGRPTGEAALLKTKLKIVSSKASESLKGTIAQGEPQRMIESFLKVWDAQAAGDGARYTFTESVPPLLRNSGVPSK